MPKIGEITDYTWVDKIGTDFLKADDINSIVNQIKSGDLKNIDENLSTPIRTEMGKGLSMGALNFGGRAPLNEISQELVEKIKRTSYGLEALEKVAEGEGNKHRKEEADTLYEKTEEHYKTLYNSVQEAVDNYNNNRDYTVKIEKTVLDGTGGTKTIEKKLTRTYDMCTLDSYSSPKKITVNIAPTYKDDTNPSKHQGYVAAVNEAVEKANEFYRNYVEPAYKLKNECASLKIYELPEGVEENASCEYMVYLNKARRETYTNPNGSTVEIYYDENGKMTNKTITNSDETTEFTKYDENGKMRKRTITKSNGSKETKEYDENGNEITTQTPGSSSNQQQPSSNNFYTYEDLQNDVKNQKNFTLPAGYQLVYDAPAWGDLKGATSADAYITSTEDNPITLEYNGKNYDAKDKNGNKLYSLNPDRLSSGSNKFSVGIGNDTTLRYDSNNDGKADTIASKSANQQQPTGTGNSSQNSNPSGSSTPSQSQPTTITEKSPKEMYYDTDNDGKTDTYGAAMMEGQKYYGVDEEGKGEVKIVEGKYSSSSSNQNQTIGTGQSSQGGNTNGNN